MRTRTAKINRLRTAATVEQLYWAHAPLLKVRAYKMASLHGVPFEELRSEANVAFVKALWAYKPSRDIKFITLLYVVLNNHLLDHCRAWSKQLPQTVEFEPGMEQAEEDGIEKLFTLKSCLKKLTKEAQGVASIVLNCPDELLEFSRSCGVESYKEGLHLFLEKLGWQKSKIHQAFEELTMSLKHDFKRYRGAK